MLTSPVMRPALPFYIAETDSPAKREILRAAMKLFSRQGLAATTIRDIAEESGYTNPALYKHFDSKDELALHLFETCHRRVWARVHAAIARGDTFAEKLDRYVTEWLELAEEHPDVIAFLSDSARVLWPRASATVRRQTMIGLARSLAAEASKGRRGSRGPAPDVVAAALQGTLGELTRMLQVGAIEGPATRWKPTVVALFLKLAR
jgi:AcrR family transcriptional regulator